jgi:hypothetical protein
VSRAEPHLVVLCHDRAVTIRRIGVVVTRRSTYRRWAYLILGGALVVPYLLVAAVAIPSIVPLAPVAD